VTADDRLTLGERFGTSAALTVYFLVGYFLVPQLAWSAGMRSHGLAIDGAIPFEPATVWAYVWAFPAAAMPAFVVASRRLFRSAALAYGLAISISLLTFLLWPETATALRPSPARLNLQHVSDWLIANIYAVDPPGNLFPSLHVSLTALSALVTWKANRLFGLVGFTGLAGVAISACTVKQHFLADVVAGLALAALIASLTISRSRHQRVPRSSEGCRAGAVYLALVGLFYAAIGGAYLAGIPVHPCETEACLAVVPARVGE